MRADRLVATLLLLQTRGRVTARQLADELEVSEKTARRDLEALAMAGLPVYPQVGRGGGWQLLGGGRTDLTGLTADEVRSLFLALGASAQTPSAVDSAVRKLVRALPETFRADAEVAARAVHVDPGAWRGSRPAETPEHLDVLQRAVVERRVITLAYTDRTQAASERTVRPLGLVSKGSVWYLLGDTDRGLRTFRVGRVRRVDVGDETFERPPDFDLSAAWQVVVATVADRRMGARATLRIDPGHVRGLRGQFGDEMLLAEVDATADEHGRETVIVGGPTPLVIAEHLAGWGNLVEVVDPPEVRDHLARLGRELAELYGG